MSKKNVPVKLPLKLPNRSNIDFDATRRINIKDIALDDVKIVAKKTKSKRIVHTLVAITFVVFASIGLYFSQSVVDKGPDLTLDDEHPHHIRLKSREPASIGNTFAPQVNNSPAVQAAESTEDSSSYSDTTYIDSSENYYPSYDDSMYDATPVEYQTPDTYRNPASDESGETQIVEPIE